MNILSFDTSTKDLVVALDRDGRVATAVRENCLQGHSVLFLPLVDRLLDEAGLTPGDVDVFAAVVGPGSFTGIRIGVTTLRTLCQVTGRPGMAVNSLEYRAYTVPCRNQKCVALDAMQNKVYYALYDGDRELAPPDFCERQELKGRLPADCALFADVQLDVPARPFADLGERLAAFVRDHLDRTGDYRRIEPLYVRRCQAEETLAKTGATGEDAGREPQLRLTVEGGRKRA